MRNLLIASILTITSCLSEEPIKFNSDQVTRLIASDSAKTWVLAERHVNNIPVDLMLCEEDDYYIFSQPFTAQDTAVFQIETGAFLCPGQTDSTLFKGTWQVLDSTDSQYILWVLDTDSAFRKVDLITSQLLRLSYQESLDEIAEDFVVP